MDGLPLCGAPAATPWHFDAVEAAVHTIKDANIFLQVRYTGLAGMLAPAKPALRAVDRIDPLAAPAL